MYRARDTKLDREVAIKVIPEAHADDLAGVARLVREAKILAEIRAVTTTAGSTVTGSVSQVVPFLGVSDMERSMRFYVAGLEFTITKQGLDGGKVLWCWLTKGAASVVLHEFWSHEQFDGQPTEKLGQGVSLAFICDDAVAMYRDFTARGIEASEPLVGNAMWSFSLSDPDGYRIEFESPTDSAEETRLSDMSRL